MNPKVLQALLAMAGGAAVGGLGEYALRRKKRTPAMGMVLGALAGLGGYAGYDTLYGRRNIKTPEVPNSGVITLDPKLDPQQQYAFVDKAITDRGLDKLTDMPKGQLIAMYMQAGYVPEAGAVYHNLSERQGESLKSAPMSTQGEGVPYLNGTTGLGIQLGVSGVSGLAPKVPYVGRVAKGLGAAGYANQAWNYIRDQVPENRRARATDILNQYNEAIEGGDGKAKAYIMDKARAEGLEGALIAAQGWPGAGRAWTGVRQLLPYAAANTPAAARSMAPWLVGTSGTSGLNNIRMAISDPMDKTMADEVSEKMFAPGMARNVTAGIFNAGGPDPRQIYRNIKDPGKWEYLKTLGRYYGGTFTGGHNINNNYGMSNRGEEGAVTNLAPMEYDPATWADARSRAMMEGRRDSRAITQRALEIYKAHGPMISNRENDWSL